MICGLCGMGVQAAPMAYKGGVMVMSEFSADERELGANYAFTNADAVGVAHARQRGQYLGATVRRETSHITYTRLAKRWNLPDAQANVWLFGNLGQARGSDLANPVTTAEPGLQVDYETTRVYAALTARTSRSLGGTSAERAAVRHDSLALRGGFSFYNTEYDETQPWFILQIKQERGWKRETQVTPMLRLINKNFFAELGVNQVRGGGRGGQFNLMFTY
jgi:hypothetical protein